jgi:hypothetical protein
LVWGVAEVAGIYPRLCTLSLLPLDLPRAALACYLVFSEDLLLTFLRWYCQVLGKDYLAWVMTSLNGKYFTLYYLTCN